jgi:hypothetical protein
MGQIPELLYGRPFNQYTSKKDECIGTLGDSYYNKLVGGVECDPVEISKVVIIKYLLSKYNPITGEGLDCIYNQRPFVGVNDADYNAEDQLNDTTHLQMFTSYLNAICAVQDPITKIIIKTIPMGIEPFSLANEDGSVQFSIDNGITYESNVEISGGETVYIKAAEADCGAVCGASAYDLYVTTVPEGETPLNLNDWLDSLKGPQGDPGEDATITGIEWKGTWSANPGTPYVNNNAVQSQGSSWILVNSTLGSAATNPAADTSGRWDKLALAGLQGPPGANGAFGIAGFRNISTGSTWTIVGNQFSKPVPGSPGNYTTEVGGTNLNGSTSTDQGALVSITSGATFTITVPNTTTLPTTGTANSTTPGNFFPDGYQVTFTQTGSGQLKINPADTNVLILSTDNSRYTRTTYSTATLIRVNGNTWYLFGDIVPMDVSVAI